MKQFFTTTFLLCALFATGVCFSHPEDEVYEACELPADNIVPSSSEVLGGEIALVAGLIAVIVLLMKVLKLRVINELFKRHKVKWLKPYISIALGAGLGGLTAYQTGIGLFQSIVAGLMSGAAAVGVHEAMSKSKKKKREQ